MRKTTRIVLALLLSVLAVLGMSTAVFAAASPLGYSDFHYYGSVSNVDKNGNYTREGGWTNYVDYINKNPNKNYWVFFRDNGYDTPENIRRSNRGIGMGSTTSQLVEAYGKGAGRVQHIYDMSKEPGQAAKYYTKSDVPTYKITYSYKNGKKTFHKSFYCDVNDQVCFILWWWE